MSRPAATLLLCLTSMALSSPASADELCENLAYGISIKTVGDWKIEKCAKLEIDLHKLTDDQLLELFDAYEKDGVVRLIKGKRTQNTYVTISFNKINAKRPTPMEYAQYLERTSGPNGYQVVEPPTEKQLSGSPAVYLARVIRPGFVVHQYFLKRARSMVEISCMLPESTSTQERDAALGMIESMKVDLEADTYRK